MLYVHILLITIAIYVQEQGMSISLLVDKAQFGVEFENDKKGFCLKIFLFCLSYVTAPLTRMVLCAIVCHR